VIPPNSQAFTAPGRNAGPYLQLIFVNRTQIEYRGPDYNCKQ
jgi:hypothetical protein